MKCERARYVLEKFHRLELGTFPTPLQRMEHLQELLGTDIPLFIKRDDLTGVGAGGNKIRNLEYLLGDAVSRKADVIIASGKNQSNLCALTVSSCRRAGLDCIIVHNDSRPEQMEGNQLLNMLSGADMRYIGDMADTEREKYVEELCRKLQSEGRNPYVIRNGASTAMGALGYVHAMMELCLQCGERNLSLRNLFVPGGNGGLAAGCIFGAGLCEAPFHVHVITVEHEKEKLTEILHGFLKEMAELTGELSDADFDRVFTVHGEYRGRGWGYSTEESDRLICDLARTEGIFVEKVYTSKTLYGMTDLVKKGEIAGNACYLHSGGFGALFGQF